MLPTKAADQSRVWHPAGFDHGERDRRDVTSASNIPLADRRRLHRGQSNILQNSSVIISKIASRPKCAVCLPVRHLVHVHTWSMRRMNFGTKRHLGHLESDIQEEMQILAHRKGLAVSQRGKFGPSHYDRRGTDLSMLQYHVQKCPIPHLIQVKPFVPRNMFRWPEANGLKPGDRFGALFVGKEKVKTSAHHHDCAGKVIRIPMIIGIKPCDPYG